MSTNYEFYKSEVYVLFSDNKEKEEVTEKFLKEIKTHNELVCKGEDDCPLYVDIWECEPEQGKNKIEIYFYNGTESNDVDLLISLIKKYFPTAKGIISWAAAEVASSGFVRYADGGMIKIENGAAIKL